MKDSSSNHKVFAWEFTAMSNTQNFSKIVLTLLCCFLFHSPQVFGEDSTSAKKDKTWSEDKRFVDNGDNTVTDSQSGFMWVKMDSYIHTGHWLDWDEAIEYVNALNKAGFAGHHDWKLPTLEELKTLFEEDKFNSRQVGSEMNIHIDPIFSKNGAGAMWSIETNGVYNGRGVIFNHGRAFSGPKKSKSRKATRAVRVAEK